MAEILLKALDALWQVVVVGLVLGAGLPALFALGVRAMSSGRTSPDGRGRTRCSASARWQWCSASW